MVKGLTRRVVVIKPPNKQLFEEAVFFLSDSVDRGVSSAQIVAEAQSIASGFTHECFRKHSNKHYRAALWVLLGAVSSSLIWACVMFFL